MAKKQASPAALKSNPKAAPSAYYFGEEELGTGKGRAPGGSQASLNPATMNPANPAPAETATAGSLNATLGGDAGSQQSLRVALGNVVDLSAWRQGRAAKPNKHDKNGKQGTPK